MKINFRHLIDIITKEFLYYLGILFFMGGALMLYSSILNESLIAGYFFLSLFILPPTIFNFYMWKKKKNLMEPELAKNYIIIQILITSIFACFLLTEVTT
ncbi:hypothetical protein [Flavobacterium limnophilum]|uniref:hypothetical protein n=1 Tax=Flavobacterium limnophilum TaxID=3003262 RepID=UPI002482B399|nr:hypothetical protein [Flavobacterium limnophilum]